MVISKKYCVVVSCFLLTNDIILCAAIVLWCFNVLLIGSLWLLTHTVCLPFLFLRW